jgi:hypothetical protein
LDTAAPESRSNLKRHQNRRSQRSRRKKAGSASSGGFRRRSNTYWKRRKSLPVFYFFAIFASFCSKLLVCFEGDCVARAIVEEDCPRKGRKDTEMEKPASSNRAWRPAGSLRPVDLPAFLPCFPFFPWSNFLPSCPAAGSRLGVRFPGLVGGGTVRVSTTKHTKHRRETGTRLVLTATCRFGGGKQGVKPGRD